MRCLLLVVIGMWGSTVAMGAEPAAAWKFDAEVLRPFWLSTTMHGESVLFVQPSDDAPAQATLLFEPTEILAVQSSSGEVTYEEGRDYQWKPGSKEIVLPAGSAIVSKRPQDLRRPAKSQPYALTHRDGNGEILFGGKHEYHDMQTVVTYKHRPGAWTGPTPTFAGQQLPRTLAKLKARQPLTIALLGDSISTGCNASGWCQTPPFQPPYQDLLVAHLKAVYGGEVTLKNFAVGGMTAAWGRQNIDKVIAAQPDLVLLAFGMNDSGGRSAQDFLADTQAMIEAVHRSLPEAEVILIATMRGNPDWVHLKQELFGQYRDGLAGLCGPGVALADLTSMWTELLRHKKDCDLTGNGVNHPNDFSHRLYAQVLSALLIETFPAE